MNWLFYTTVLILVLFLALQVWRLLDLMRDRRTWRLLTMQADPVSGIFQEDLIAGLPEPARRYFRYSIKPGTPLYRVTEIRMEGELGFGQQADPGYRRMSAHQILAPPYGLVWRVRIGAVSGSDGVEPGLSWTRFWFLGFLPVARAGNNPDHHRSAFGRVVAEAAFWTPAAFLPQNGVYWESVDADTARAVVKFGSFEQAVDIVVGDDGQPVRVIIQRWSNENAERVFREQPFGGDLFDFQDFSGYRLPTRVEGGNHMGTPDYFPFYCARVTSIRFPQDDS